MSDSAKPPSTIDTYSPEHQHRCLVRKLLRLRLESREKVMVELNGEGRWPGYKTKNPRVYEDVLRQWNLGNRGKEGDWRE